MTIIQELTFDDIAVGYSAEFEHTITQNDVDSFARLSGDNNPLHVDETYAAKTKFGRRVVHGMLAASLFSQLVGVHVPGKYCLYLSQDLQFRNPIVPGTRVRVAGSVTAKMDSFKMLDIQTTITDVKTNKQYVTGKAKVQVLK